MHYVNIVVNNEHITLEFYDEPTQEDIEQAKAMLLESVS